jgi:hypothetical protein
MASIMAARKREPGEIVKVSSPVTEVLLSCCMPILDRCFVLWKNSDLSSSVKYQSECGEQQVQGRHCIEVQRWRHALRLCARECSYGMSRAMRRYRMPDFQIFGGQPGLIELGSDCLVCRTEAGSPKHREVEAIYFGGSKSCGVGEVFGGVFSYRATFRDTEELPLIQLFQQATMRREECLAHRFQGDCTRFTAEWEIAS